MATCVPDVYYNLAKCINDETYANYTQTILSQVIYVKGLLVFFHCGTTCVRICFAVTVVSLCVDLKYIVHKFKELNRCTIQIEKYFYILLIENKLSCAKEFIHKFATEIANNKLITTIVQFFLHIM